MNWNKRLSEQRIGMGLTKAEFSRRVGVSGATVTDWENGVIKAIDGRHLVKAASVLQVDPEWLLTGRGEAAAHAAAMEPRADYGPYAELIDSWDLLTQAERADFLQQIKARAAHNQAVMEQLTVRKRTVSVSERRLAQSGVPYGERRAKKNGT